MPDDAKNKSVKNGWKDFLRGAIVGLIFSVGFMLVEFPRSESISRIILHVLTPSAIVGFFGVLIGEWLRRRIRSGLFVYSAYTITGAICGALLFVIISSSSGIILTGIGIYFSIWIGVVIGASVRLSLDEIITESRKRRKNENATSW